MSNRAQFAAAAVFLASLPAEAYAQAPAQQYPSKPVRMIVPFGAGGPADVFARVLAQHLSEQLKQSFVIENRPGAGAIIGTDAVAKSAPDGYTLLVMSNTHTTNESLIPNRPYQLMRDFVPSRADQLFGPADGRPSVGGRQDAQGVHRARQVEARSAQLRLVGAGHALSHGRRAVQSHEWHRHRPCAAQELPGDMRSSVIGGHVQMMFDAITVMAEGVRSGQLVGPGHHRCQALGGDAGDADDRRGGRAGLRGHDLARPDGAGRHAQADHRPAQCRGRQGHEPRRREGGLGQAGRGADAHELRPSSTSILRADIEKWAQVVKVSGAKAE